MPDIELKRLNQCSFQTALEVWNKGFQGYFVDMTLSLDSFLTRITAEGISPEYSFVAFAEDKPVGFLLNGLRQVGGKKLAWNGGTGVAPGFRGQGIGKVLVGAALEMYAAEGVNLAMLEAISTNQPAIALYNSFGYEIVDELLVLQTNGPLKEFSASDAYTVSKLTPAAVSSLSFYRELSPWQAQAMSVTLNHGEALILVDKRGETVCYALYKRRFDDHGNLVSIALYQCEVAPSRGDAEGIVATALESVFSPVDSNCLRRAVNLSKTNRLVIDRLLDSGLQTFIEQLHMMKNILECGGVAPLY
jgi:GNAT superfamily N-acetyltransferase